MFLNKFRIIYLIRGEIETALAFSKVSIIYQYIINTTELMLILDEIYKTSTLVCGRDKNLVQLEKSMVVRAFVKGNQITYTYNRNIFDR